MAMMANTEVNEGVFRRYHADNNPVNKTDVMGLFPGPCGNEDAKWVPDRPFWVLDFSKPCQAHDDCYGCVGEKQGRNKAACDLAFFVSMQKICFKYIAIPGLFQSCTSAASIYYAAVSFGAKPAFKKARQYCGCP
jgi:hypothetical protein